METKLTLDTTLFLSTIEAANRLLEVRDSLIGLPEPPLELGRVKACTTVGAGKLRATLNPSDDLLEFVAALRTGQIDGCVIKCSGH